MPGSKKDIGILQNMICAGVSTAWVKKLLIAGDLFNWEDM